MEQQISGYRGLKIEWNLLYVLVHGISEPYGYESFCVVRPRIIIRILDEQPEETLMVGHELLIARSLDGFIKHYVSTNRIDTGKNELTLNA